MLRNFHKVLYNSHILGSQKFKYPEYRTIFII